MKLEHSVELAPTFHNAMTMEDSNRNNVMEVPVTVGVWHPQRICWLKNLSNPPKILFLSGLSKVKALKLSELEEGQVNPALIAKRSRNATYPLTALEFLHLEQSMKVQLGW